MTTTGRRFWVEVSPRFAAPVDPPVDPPACGGVPRLTALAVAAGLDGAELDAELASVHRQRSALAAYELGLIERKAALGARQPLPFAPAAGTAGGVADLLDEEEAWQACDDFLPDEVAVLVNASVPSTRHLVDYALTLVRELPVVWHALADGRIDESRARAIVNALKHQAASAGGPVDDAIVDALAGCGVGWAERGCGPSALHDRLVAALIAADPAAADRRRETTKRGADAVVVPTGDGLGELRLLHVDVADLELARAQVDAYARKIKADGDERPIGQIRIAVILALIMRPWEARDPAVAHLTVNADLADLLLPDLEPLLPTCDQTATDQTTGDDGDTLGDVDTAVGTHAGAQAQTDANACADDVDQPGAGDAEDVADGDAEPRGDVDGEDPGDRWADIGREGVGDDIGNLASDGRDPGNAGRRDPAADQTPSDATTPSGVTTPRGAGCAEGGRSATADGSVRAIGSSRAGRAVQGTGLPIGGAQVGHVDGLPVSPTAVRQLLRRIDALGLTHPEGGHLALTITGDRGRLLAVATPEELEAAARSGVGLGPPPATTAYRPTAAQYRYLRARDRHCRFPGCRNTALTAEADHVLPYDHRDPTHGGQTCITNLTMLCKRHHLLKTHAPGWHFTLDPDGTLHVTTPGGTTRTTRPPAADEVLDLLEPPHPLRDPAADPPPF